ncbi:MAG: hypothetical protein L0G99_10160 [Propionibacteriales bacterium]|nr:hypothetical protein [Propionibacteriales bacterium]
MRLKSVLAAASVTGVALAGFVMSPSASGGLVTTCVGTAGAVTVPGDLVVPAGKSCTLEGTTIEGKVSVRAGADLVISNGTIKGAVGVAEDGYIDAYRTAVTGNVSSTGAYGVYFDESQVAGSYTGKAGKEVAPFVFLGDSQVAKNFTVAAGETLVDSSKIAGNVTGTGGSYVDVINSTLGRALTVSNQTDGALVCGSEVDGAASLTGNAGVQIGTGSSLSTCDDVNYFGGDVTVSNNTVGTAVNGNIIRGNLAGEGNDPAPTGADNRVRGEATGQFADLGAAPAKAQVQRRSAAKAADRVEVTKDKAAERKAEAKDAAADAGPAKL